jgi:biopolymer transport protein ExbD
MIRVSKLLVCLLVLLGLALPVLAADATGKVKSVDADKNQFVIADSNQKNWTFQLARNGKVFIDDKEAKLSDLQVDHEVTIRYEKEGEILMASEVRCKKK